MQRPFGVLAGLVAAAALAVLPIEVITARSDTMDAVMMMLLVLALHGGHAAYLPGMPSCEYCARALFEMCRGLSAVPDGDPDAGVICASSPLRGDWVATSMNPARNPGPDIVCNDYGA